jgi:isoleucyl-tRNA synthetase
LRRSRDRLKGDTNEVDRKLAVETLGYVLLELSKTLAPFMPFLSERVYQGVTEGHDGYRESVHLENWPLGGHIDEVAVMTMEDTRRVVSLGLEARNKVGIKVRQPLQSLSAKDLKGLTEEYFDLIRDEVNVKDIIENSSLESDVVLDTTISEELQKEGNIRELARAIKDLRKEAGLGQGDIAMLIVHTNEDGKIFIVDVNLDLKKLCSLSDILFEENDTLAVKEVILSDIVYRLYIK